MIKTIGDLLDQFRQKEVETIDRLKIQHPPTIGAMYEGLTQKILGMSLPSASDLRVVSGFIRDSAGTMSAEIDCMLVNGEGTEVSHTQKFIYPIEQVVATIEVKKTLTPTELASAHENSLSFTRFVPKKDIKINLCKDAFECVTQRAFPTLKNLASYSEHDQLIYHSLITEAALPVRIIFSYGGYKTEGGFRRAFLRYLEQQNGVSQGLGPTLLPNLVISGPLSIIKTNGMPFSVRRDSNNEWVLLASYHKNSLQIFLELIWTRLNYYFDVDASIFGEDLDFEFLLPLLESKYLGNNHWQYGLLDLSRKNRNNGSDSVPWTPVEISMNEFIFINVLKESPSMTIDDPGLVNFFQEKGVDHVAFFDDLRKKGLIDFDGKHFNYLTKEMMISFLPDGRIVAGDNNSGRFMRWVKKQYEMHSKKK